MNSSTLSGPTTRHTRRTKAKKRTTRSKSRGPTSNGGYAVAAAGTLTRTKALLLAALRVWELKHRIND